MEKLPKKLKIWRNKPFIKQLEKKFPKADLFLVGGAVRDHILDRPTKDYDLVIRNISKNDLEKFLKNQGKVNLVGKKFGVFKFVPKGWTGSEIDIALPRTEHSINLSGAYKDFKINSNAKLKIEDDLSRRDFTINAMAYDIKQQKIIDPYNGLKDIKQKNIKAVGKAEQRFKEDYSRMLRAIRFSCQLEFDIESKTLNSIKKEIKKLNKTIDGKRVVPYEVIAKELFKAVNVNPIKAIELLDKTGAIQVLMPELLKMKKCPQPKNWHTEGDVWVHTILALEKLNSQKFKREFKGEEVTPELIWGVIFHDLGKPYTLVRTDRLRFNNHDNVGAKKFKEIAERLKLASAGLDVDDTEKIIAKHLLAVYAKGDGMKDTTLEKYFFNPNFPGRQLMMLILADTLATIHDNGKPHFAEYNKLKSVISKLKKKTKGKNNLPQPVINGTDLIKKFKLNPGPKIGKLLTISREAQLRGKIKSKADGLKLIKKHL
ncbi:MAG: hypothetical protein CMI53_02755 [Parcubacteria group bacterium]|jgi:poly(A) polymerase|nr:hypothetical protein [Parcubacteria group bacterium]|tara:strand:+ start:2768 stop:4225 length:1458 start_codon:yes stop_codon:yes gene_type:complete